MNSNIHFFDLHPHEEDFRDAILRGLQQQPKAVPAKCLYDKRGAELFVAITQQPEYYLTRTEVKILTERRAEIAALLDEGVLVEYGSGSSQKVRVLLDAVLESKRSLPVYVALDISQAHLLESCEAIAAHYPELTAIALCADYTQPLALPAIAGLQDKPKTAFFPGSTLGNLQPEEAIAFLANVSQLVGPGGNLLIGFDLAKDASILEPAYDDAAGISGQFALNLLARINRELDGNFQIEQFCYRSFYNPEMGRIEMYIESQVAQTVTVGDQPIVFAAGERLLTEYSYKYSPESFQALALQAGFKTAAAWRDGEGLFEVSHLVAL